MKSLVFFGDANKKFDEPIHQWPDAADSESYVLTAATNEVVTAPTGARFAKIYTQATGVYMEVDSAAVVPAADTATGASVPVEMYPWIRIDAAQTLNFIQSAGGAVVSVQFFS